MSTFYPNEGELLILLTALANLPMKVGIYKNVVAQDGGVTYAQFSELTQGGGRAYATKVLDNKVQKTALTTSTWYLYVNSQGKAEADYCYGTAPTAYIDWTMNSVDAADAATAHGIFGWAVVIPFDQGSAIINAGDTVTWATSTATASVADVIVMSGTWAGTAAGYLIVENQSTTAFQDNENLQVATVTKAVSNTGTTFGGDSHKFVLFVDPFTEAKAITDGLKIRYTPIHRLTTV